MIHYALTKAKKLGISIALALVLSFIWTIVAYANGPGTLDTSFNGTGIVTTSVSSTDDFGYSVAIQPDDKIVVAGLSDNGLVPGDTINADVTVIRYNTDGSLDASFNHTGILTTSLGIGSGGGSQNAVAIQPDGKIVVAASINNGTSYINSDFALLR